MDESSNSDFDLAATVGQQVVRLPTAQRRQVKQPQNRAGREARKRLREQQAREFPFRFPSERKAEKLAETILSVERTPELALMLAIVGTMDRDHRARVMMTLNEMADRDPSNESARKAASIMATTILDVGEAHDLNRALDRLSDH